MNVYEMLSFNREILHKIYTAGVKVNDYKYVDMYTEYCQMKNASEKVTYIVHYLSDKHSISERQVYSIVNRMQQDISTANPMQLERV